MRSISVILCAYTEARWGDLVEAVASVRRQTHPADEIIVAVDHNPTLLERARRELPDCKMVANEGARGLSGARNSGIAAATGAIIAFLDDDAVAEPTWLAQLWAAYDDPHVAGAGGAIEPLWLSGKPQWMPVEFHWVVGCTYRGMPERPTPVRNLIGCNMSFRRELVEQIGGFRIGRVGALSMGQENDETELCIRLGAAHPEAQLLFLPTARVQHRVPQNRATLRYFVRRTFSEGLSKATLSRQVGRSRGLSTERAYTMRTLPTGVLRGLGDGLRGRVDGVLRAGAIGLGLLVTVAGYGVGRARGYLADRKAPPTRGDHPLNPHR